MAQLKDLPIDSMVIFHSYVMLVYQRVIGKMMIHHWIDFGASYFQSISTFNAFNVGILQIFVQFRAAFPCQWLIKVGTRSKNNLRGCTDLSIATTSVRAPWRRGPPWAGRWMLCQRGRCVPARCGQHECPFPIGWLTSGKFTPFNN